MCVRLVARNLSVLFDNVGKTMEAAFPPRSEGRGFRAEYSMKKGMFAVVLGLCGALCLSGLAWANPLLGRWQVVSVKASDLMNQLSIDRYKSLQPKEISFTEKEMGVLVHEKENKVPVQYKQVSETEWTFSVDEGKTWNSITVQPDGTLLRKEKKDLDVEIVYTLKKMPESAK